MKTMYNSLDDCIYGTNKSHKLMYDQTSPGINGENLTIVILSCNRSKQTIKLLTTIEEIIPDYAGKIIVFDNDSTLTELKALEKYLKTCKHNINLIKNDKNYGVAGGRNRAYEYVTTEWFMSLDNDIYLVKNPLVGIENTIRQLGCKFLNLPLLNENKSEVFSDGGSLYIDNINGQVLLGAGSQFQSTPNCEGEASLGTFLFGGASVVNTRAFSDLGKLDENMFIGFEDLDFSISIFNAGYKIGNCPIFALVHDHSIVYSEADLNYEKNRFSSEIIQASALYLEKKRGFTIWNKEVELWLKNRNEKLNLKKQNKSVNKKKILLVVDVRGWALWNIACQVKKHLSSKFEIDIIAVEDVKNIAIVMMYAKRFDLVHFFWRGHFIFLKEENMGLLLQEYSLTYKDFKKMYLDNVNFTTSVYDHLYLEKNDMEFTHEIVTKYPYTVSSEKLFNIYNDLIDKEKENTPYKITDGVETEKFFPINLERFNDISNRSVIIGWVGNSAWNGKEKDNKGVNTILKPAIKELKDEGYNIEEYFADRQVRMIPHNEMNNYYGKIDVLICSSDIEGTPNPVLEAMACGVPIISTNVGIVEEALGEEQQEFILKTRSVEEMKRMIIKFIELKENVVKLSQENLTNIKNWEWKKITEKFDIFFSDNLNK